MSILKKYVLNRAHREGSITKGYRTEKHKQIIFSQNPTKSEACIIWHHLETFSSWLSEQFIGDSMIHPQLALLARGPNRTIVKLYTYDINGYTLYTRDQD
jgi:hypothetical protein